MTIQAKLLSERVMDVLGHGHSKASIIASALVALLIFFYIFSLSSSLGIEIFFLKNRITYASNFHYYLISDHLDKIIICISASSILLLVFRKKVELVAAIAYVIATLAAIITTEPYLLTGVALLSFPWIVCLLVYRKVVNEDKAFLALDRGLVQNYVALSLIFLGIESLILSIFPILSTNLERPDSQNYAFLIFALFSSSSPILLSLLVFCLPTKILIDELVTFIKSIKKRTTGALSTIDVKSFKMKTRTVFISLSLTVLLSIAFAAIPHVTTINKENQQIGADADVYVRWQNLLMRSNSTLQFLDIAFVKIGGGDRPISLSFFLALSKISGDLLYTTDRLPMILGPLLVIAIFFLTRELTSNDFISLFAAFLTTLSFHTTVGLYAGYYSNWFALIVGYFSMMFLLKCLKNPNKVNIISFSTLLIATLFSHAYTWSILVLVMSIFLGVSAKLKYYNRKRTAILFVVIAASVAVDLLRVQLTGTSGALESDSAVAISQGAGLQQFSEKWKNLTETVWTYYGGLMSNFLIYSLCIYWLIKTKKKQVHSVLIMTFLSIGILPLLFSGWVIQTRVLYDIPFQIPAAIGLYAIRRESSGSLFISAICIWLLAVSVRAVTNLNL